MTVSVRPRAPRGATPPVETPIAPLGLLRPDQERAVRARMTEVLEAVAGPLYAPAARIAAAPGKLLRPALVLAAAGAGADDTATDDAVVAAAAAIELMHCATLVHDDLVDGARLRRGVPTVNALEGPSVAVVCGDLLIAAAQTSALDAGPGALPLLTRTLAALCVGQALEDRHRRDPATTVATALEIARGKTGSLLRAACRIGADAAGVDPVFAEALERFGEHLGVELQLLDDVLDLSSSSRRAGKPTGSDLAAGTMTVPLCFAVRAQPELASVLASESSARAQRRALESVRSGPALRRTVCLADEQAALAEAALAPLLSAGGRPRQAAERLGAWPWRYADALLPERSSAVRTGERSVRPPQASPVPKESS